MSQRVDSITQNVKGETDHMKSKFTDLEKNLKDLSSGGLFGQIDSMIQELKRLNELNDKYEMSHFLISAELERRALMVSDCAARIQQLDSELRQREVTINEVNRLREDETTKLKRQLEYEVQNASNLAANDKQRLERRIQELQGELSRRDNQLEELNRNLAQYQDAMNKLKMEGQSSYNKQQEMQRAYEGQIAGLKNDHAQELRQLEIRYQTDMENMRRQLEDEKHKEVEKQKTMISNYYSEQLTLRDREMNQSSQKYEAMASRLAELERENQGIHSQLDHRTKEVSDLKDQLLSLRKSHDEYNVRITETHKLTIQKALIDREKELRDKLEIELSKLEKELKEKKGRVLTLEQKVIFTEKENQRNASRLSDMTVERDELKSKLIDAEKRLSEEIRMVEETLTVQIHEHQSEIDSLILQNRDMSERFNMQMEQERERANSASIDNDMLRKEVAKLKELSDKRNREIEEWRTKYKGYITGEE